MAEEENTEIKKQEEVKEQVNTKDIVSKAEFDDLTDRYKRILAEFENHKKRSQKE